LNIFSTIYPKSGFFIKKRRQPDRKEIQAYRDII
jgi:hypothetical protein